MPYWFDGNNLIGQPVAAARAHPDVRNQFLSILCAYRRAGGGRFVVYFDGDDPAPAAAPPGVAVRYSAPLSADARMTERLREIRNPAEIIVVTNDRELASRCKGLGASTMGWSEFQSKMRSRIGRRQRAEPEPSVDVEEWMRYFGLDKTGRS